MTVKHTTVVTVPDDGTSPVGSDEWNANHSVVTDLSPDTDDGAPLGTLTGPKRWADLFMATGGVINWGSGNVTITHATTTLTFAGASTGGYQFSHAVKPTANDGAALGSTALQWSDLFVASGAVVNFNNGDTMLTHVDAGGGSHSIVLESTTASNWNTQFRAATTAQPRLGVTIAGESFSRIVFGCSATDVPFFGFGPGSATRDTYITYSATAGLFLVGTTVSGTDGQITAKNLRTVASTVANLTAAATAGQGARAMVTDATATTFNSVVAGAGANIVPVFSDGTNWRIG